MSFQGPLFIFGTQLKIFLIKSETSIDSKGPTMFKAQKGTKNINKIVHVTSVVQSLFYEATRILSVRKKNKNNHFIQQFFSPELPSTAIIESTTMHACGAADVEHACAAPRLQLCQMGYSCGQ